jgi:peptidoglycan/LPS O-acetylase OafA/YrhL
MPSSIPAPALDAFNWIRGVAALTVLAFHVRHFFFVNWGGQVSTLRRWVYFLTGLGHQAVIVFFVLSGALVGTSVVEASRLGGWSWKRYSMRRLTRLYIVLVPALLLSWGWDAAGMSLFGSAGLYGGRGFARFVGVPDVRSTLTLHAFFGSFLFVQDFLTPAFGANTPLWTLACEFWSYLLFPLLFRAIIGDEKPLARILFALAATAILVGGGSLLCVCFCFWSCGAAVPVLRAYKPGWLRDRPGQVLGASILTGLAVVVSRRVLLHTRSAGDLLLAAVAALLLAAILARGLAAAAASATLLAPPSKYSRWGEQLAGFSYTLYAAQHPVIIFAAAGLLGPRRWMPDFRLATIATLVAGGIVAYSFLLARLTEARTNDVRRWLERWRAL